VKSQQLAVATLLLSYPLTLSSSRPAKTFLKKPTAKLAKTIQGPDEFKEGAAMRTSSKTAWISTAVAVVFPGAVSLYAAPIQ
jgi:hypothetical protein